MYKATFVYQFFLLDWTVGYKIVSADGFQKMELELLDAYLSVCQS